MRSVAPSLRAVLLCTFALLVLAHPVLAWAALPGAALPAAERVVLAPAPAWAGPFDPNVPKGEPSGGLALSLLDQRARYVGGHTTRFTRVVLDIANASGAAAAGQRTFAFKPAYESLVVHRLEVRRGDQVLSHLRPGALEVLRREAGLESSFLDGGRTALAVLPDVRPGDRVVYEYSLVGDNPVLAGHLAMTWPQQTHVPIGRLRYELSSDRPLASKALGGAAAAEEERRGGLFVYQFSRDHVPAAEAEESVPPGDFVVPLLQWSDVAQWDAVAAWGRALFAIPRAAHPSVVALANELRAHAVSREARILAALGWVQENVRYVSLAIAESSHRPAPPEVVLARRFGDCKDKSRLLVALLGELGIVADVALVVSDGGAELPAVLPSVGAFDHAVVSLELGPQRLWLDPTRSHQRGGLLEVSQTRLRHGLVLREGTVGLTKIESTESAFPDIAVRLTYRARAIGEPVHVEARVAYSGSIAEGVRALQASSSAKELTEVLGKPLRNVHPELVFAKDARVVENPGGNGVIVEHEGSLENPWGTDDRHEKIMTIGPPWLQDVVPSPGPTRKHALALGFPFHVVHDVQVELGEPLSIKPETTTVEGALVSFHYELQGTSEPNGSRTTWHYDLRTRTERVEPAQFPELKDALRRIKPTLSASVFRAKPPTGAVPYALYFAYAGWLAALGYATWWVRRHRPYWRRPGVQWVPGSRRFSGWLALLSLHVTFAPISMLVSAIPVLRLMAPSSWVTLTSPESAQYDPLWAFAIVVDAFGYTALFVGTVGVAVLYWRRQRSFPLVFVVVASFFVVLAVVDSIVVAQLPTEPDAKEPYASNGAAAGRFLVWMVYVLRSTRVKSTFLSQADADGAPEAGAVVTA